MGRDDDGSRRGVWEVVKVQWSDPAPGGQYEANEVLKHGGEPFAVTKEGTRQIVWIKRMRMIKMEERQVEKKGGG